jgi:hypothetical protein
MPVDSGPSFQFGPADIPGTVESTFAGRQEQLMRLCLPIVITLLLPAASAAQTTPWGDPDLQGVWSNQTPVPLERPAALADKPFFTKEEAADVEKNALATVLKNVAAEIATSGEFSEIWLESGKGKVNRSLRTSLVADPADGKIPFTPAGRARWAATPNLLTERITGKQLGADTPEDRALQERCITSDNMFVPSAFYNNYHQIVQAPGYVVILSEMMHDARVIPLDRRPRIGVNIRQWLGDARGWWEGRTLVVETANFNDKRRFQGSTKDLRLVERFTRTDNDTITYRLTVVDPNTYSQPWTLENIMWRTDEPIFEVGCHEGNVGITGILAGARAAER